MALSKILLSDNLTELTGVKSVVYKEVASADVNIHGGCVCSASIEVEVYGTQATAVSAGDVVYYYQYDKNNVATLIGIFNCEPVIETKTSYKFVAYDNAQKLKADFSQWLQANQSNFPMAVYALVSAACTVAGVTLGSASWGLSTQSVQAFYSDGITCRDILSYAAEIGCCFVRCHTDGNVYFDWFSSNANTIAPSVGTGQYAYKQDGLNYANYTTAALDRVAVHPSGEDDVAYIYPTGITSGNTLHIQNNLLLTGADAAFYNAVAQQVYTVMSSLGTYRPMTANLFVKENPFRAGDIVSVTDSQSVTFTSVITALTVSESGAVLESTGNETYDEGTGNTQKAITQLASDVVRINKLKVDWADINTAIINYLTANNVTAQNLTIVDENGNVLATYDSSGITLGNSSEVHAEIDFNSFELFDKDGNLYTFIGDARNVQGLADVKYTYNLVSQEDEFLLKPPANDVSSVVVKKNGSVITTGFTVTTTKVTFSQYQPSGTLIEISYKTLDPFYQYMFGTLKSGTELGYYSFAAGENATSNYFYTTVGGGSENSAIGWGSTVSGGINNTSGSGVYSTVSGGYGNKATAIDSVVSGGNSNTASGANSVVSGGENNTASGGASTVSGGAINNATDSSAVVSGGIYNNATGDRSAIGGGQSNTASNTHATVGGGYSNTSSGEFSAILGGRQNYATGDKSSVLGGHYNRASGVNSSISCGNYNQASGDNSSVVGGQDNVANHRSQLVFGERNIPDPSTAPSTDKGNYIEIVGNGVVGALSNARTLDWSGNEVLSGTLKTGSDVIIKSTDNNIDIVFRRNEASNGNTGIIRSSAGDATNQTNNRFYFYEYSPKSTADPANTGYYEAYRLPTPTKGRTASVNYEILTSKSAVTIAQGGTGSTGTTKETTISNVIDSASGITISRADYAVWGNVAQLFIQFKSSSAISVNSSGNITDLQIGTLKSGKRPTIYSMCVGAGEPQAWGYIDANGKVVLSALEGTGSSRTVAANTTLELYSTFILA